MKVVARWEGLLKGSSALLSRNRRFCFVGERRQVSIGVGLHESVYFDYNLIKSLFNVGCYDDSFKISVAVASI